MITTSQRELSEKFHAMRVAFQQDGIASREIRTDRIDRAIALLVDNQEAICAALAADFGCRSKYMTLMSEILICVSSLKNVKKNLKKWMQPERRKALFPMNLFGARALVHYQPKGVVGIIAPWNVPFGAAFSPLADALGAGNRCMIKPSEFTPHSATLMTRLIAEYFAPTEVVVCPGDAEIGESFSALPFDHLVFTGSTQVGRQVMAAAAKNLTPVTLELGGKSPVIVSLSCDIAKAAEQIITSKSMNAGQLCVSPDYVFVPERQLELFIARCKQTIDELFPSFFDNPDYVSLINERHYDRISGYLEEAKENGINIIALMPDNESFSDRGRHRIPLHLVINPTDDLQVMQQEIFGPLLNIKTYTDFDQCLSYINNRPKPLALYYFGYDAMEENRVLEETCSGGVAINDIGIHYANDDLPFGGIGDSGMGHYHGFDGFKTFSHVKAVFKQGRANLAKIMGSLPPYAPNAKKLDKMLAGQIRK